MSIEEFLTTELNSIKNKFKEISFEYLYEEDINFHIIKVSPEEIHRGNLDYMRAESNLWFNFRSNYPNDNLLIDSYLEDSREDTQKSSLSIFQKLAFLESQNEEMKLQIRTLEEDKRIQSANICALKAQNYNLAKDNERLSK